jgi:16S rRNA (guanine527-N7)-methyltransferase
LAFTLLDSNAKKTRFVRQAVAELGLSNVEVINERAEKYRPPRKFATLITRAFASLPDMLTSTAHLCAEGGEFLAMKGTYPASEVAQLPAGFELIEAHALHVPGGVGQRHMLRIVAVPL